MIRNLKALGLALVAILAMGALTASAASATDFFTTSKENAWLTGTSEDNVFETSGKKFECTTSKFTATVVNGASEATVLPSYNGTKGVTPHSTHCNASTGNVTIDVNHCHYVLTGNTTGKDNGTDATVWIQCPPEKSIQITSSLGLTISVPSQTPTEGGVVYTNVPNHPGGSAVTVDATATGITSTCAPAFTCGLGGIATHTNTSKYTGTVTVTGWEHKGSTETGTNAFTTPIEGNQIPIEWS